MLKNAQPSARRRRIEIAPYDALEAAANAAGDAITASLAADHRAGGDDARDLRKQIGKLAVATFEDKTATKAKTKAAGAKGTAQSSAGRQRRGSRRPARRRGRAAAGRRGRRPRRGARGRPRRSPRASRAGSTASISRSLPPSARSRSVKPKRSRLLRVVASGRGSCAAYSRASSRAPLRVRLHDDGDLGRDERVRAEALAREARVLGRREVRVGAERALAGQVEHLRAERGRHALVARHGRSAPRRARRRTRASSSAAACSRSSPPGGRCRCRAGSGPGNSRVSSACSRRHVGRVVLPDVEDARSRSSACSSPPGTAAPARWTGCRPATARRSRAPRCSRTTPGPGWWLRQMPIVPRSIPPVSPVRGHAMLCGR